MLQNKMFPFIIYELKRLQQTAAARKEKLKKIFQFYILELNKLC